MDETVATWNLLPFEQLNSWFGPMMNFVGHTHQSIFQFARAGGFSSARMTLCIGNTQCYKAMMAHHKANMTCILRYTRPNVSFQPTRKMFFNPHCLHSPHHY